MDFVSASEAAELLGVSRMWVSSLIRDGKLQAVRVGSSWVIERKDLEDLIARRAADPPKPGRPPKK